MKNKGFTLIELLAVILILGIIALIAIPTVNSVIEQSRKGSSKSSGDALVKAIEEKIITSELSEHSFVDGRYDVSELEELNLSIKGTMPDSGNVIIENSKIKSCNLWYNSYNFVCGESNDEISKIFEANSQSWIKPENSSYIAKVYYDPTTGTKCTESDVSSNINNYSTSNKNGNGEKSVVGLKNGCMIWYVYKDNGDGTVNMILDHNTTSSIIPGSSNSDTSLENLYNQLRTDTLGWQVSADLVDADDIAAITGADKKFGFSTKKNYFTNAEGTANISFNFFAADNSYLTDNLKYSWLVDNLDRHVYYLPKTVDATDSSRGYWAKNIAIYDSINTYGHDYTFLYAMGLSEGLSLVDNIYFFRTLNMPEKIGAGRVSVNLRLGIRPVVTVARNIFE